MSKSFKSIVVLTLLLAIVLESKVLRAQKQGMLRFSSATIYTSKTDKTYLQMVIKVLQEEVHKRSSILWKTSKKLSRGREPQIILSLEGSINTLPETWINELKRLEMPGKEGYRLLILPKVNKILIVAKSKRAMLYGAGKLLRKMEIRKENILIPEDLGLSSTPRYDIRGHQLGYRPKTNSYDAWTVKQFDQYIRELAIFGSNSIEIMPPRTDDDPTSQHMKLSPIDMVEAQSRICDIYDLDVWMWYPNMSQDYTNAGSIQKELSEREMVFSKIQRLDNLFVPGGDPGDLDPDILFSWLEKVSVVLHKYHPEAKIWVSPQVFRPTRAWLDAFFMHINRKYDWLGGVVFGPWVKMPLEEIRKIVEADIPIRRYPDITHSLSSQYPVPKWDLAWAVTLGRECINPRPVDEKLIHNALDQYANGSLSYSEGTNDDVNKFVWSDQDWDPETPVIETLRDYARFFIGPDYEEGIAQGLMALEQNIKGPLLTNEHIQNTLQQWKKLETIASHEVQSNFRFQMGLIRAYFDAYTQKRLIYETYLEQKAKEHIENYNGDHKAIEMCKATLAKAWEKPIYPQYKMRCEKLADDLYNSIGAQLTVERHGAKSGRGNFIDNINHPLNDVAWILSELSRAEKSGSESDKAGIICHILHRTDAGPGGFYDNFGNPAAWEKVIVHHVINSDPGNLRTPRVSFGVGLKNEEWVHEVTPKGFEGQAAPMAWMNQVTTLYDQPLEIQYEDLDSEGSYTIRIAYTGRFRSRTKMMADGTVVHDFIKTGVKPIYEFPLPVKVLKDGKVTFTWTCGEAERGSQVSEIWLIKN